MATCPIGPTCLGCAKCDPEYHTKRAAKRARQLRTAAPPNPYAPPDPYAEGLKAVRAHNDATAAARTYPAPRPTELPLDARGIPNGYAAGLAAMKKETR